MEFLQKLFADIMMTRFHNLDILCWEAFSGEFTLMLVSHITAMERALFGLTTKGMCRLALDVAEKLKLKHPFKNGKNGRWRVVVELSETTFRDLQATRLSWATGFNQAKVFIWGSIAERQLFS